MIRYPGGAIVEPGTRANQLKSDLATLRREQTVARANSDREQVVLLTLDIATVRRQMVERQRAEA